MVLLETTIKLIKDVNYLHDQFYIKFDIDNEKEFFQFVKKETNHIFITLNKWEELTLDYIKINKSKVHLNQVIATKENIELMLIHSFYKDMRKRRFMEYYHSSLYVLNELRSELE